MHFFYHLLIGITILSILFWIFHHFTLLNIAWSKGKTCFWRQFLESRNITTFLSIFFTYLQIILLWDFSFDWKNVGFYFSYSLIGSQSIDPETFPYVCYKIFCGIYIQTIHTDLIPLWVWIRFWKGWRLGVDTCYHQLIAFIDIKYFQVHQPRLSLLIFYLHFCIDWINIHWS